MSTTLQPASVRPEATEGGVRVFESESSPADPVALRLLSAGAAEADLAAPAVALPDFHLKADKEMPSSIAVATRETISPTFTCCSLNCGMALVALDVDRPGLDAIADFYARVQARLPFPPTYRRDLTVDEVVRAATEGASFAVDKYGLDEALIERIEHGGRLDVEAYGGAERIRRELPWTVKQLSRIRFATIGKSNHYIDLQQVEEVFDGETAALLGVEQGQVTMQYHGGGGALPGELGVLFGRRKRYPRALRMQMAVQKPLYHLASVRSVAQFELRRSLYFSGGFPPVERAGIEGERLMLSNLMAMNYGFAFRVAAYAILTQLIEQTFGSAGPRLVVDSPHNTIYEEEIAGEPAIVHRHNAARAFPASRMATHPVFSKTGQPLLLPGTDRTSAYLCVADEGAAGSLYSVSHGSGSNIDSFEERGLSGRDPEGHVTWRFDYDGNGPRDLEHLDDRGVDDTLAVLTAHRIVRPIARLRPFAVLS
jgi:RNA-splicing ligase RtcB